MADAGRNEDQATLIAEKLGAVLKEQRSETPRSEKIKIGLQIAQFLVVSIVGTVLSFYAERIKSQQEEHNAEVSRQLKVLETKAVQAKVIQDFMNALVDPSDRKRPLIALRAIEMFIDENFAFELGKLLKSDAADERLDQIQAQVRDVSAGGAASAVAAGSKRQGWIYLGSWRPAGGANAGWETRYFNFAKEKTPADLEREKAEVQVLATVGSANLRSVPPSNGGRLDSSSVIGRVAAKDVVRIIDVESVPNTPFYWAKVELK